MQSKVLYAFIAVLVLLNIGSFLYSANTLSQTESLSKTVANLPKEPIVYVGKDGKTPQLGIDYQLPKNGKDGINSISFSVSQTVVKEVPLIGEKGEQGVAGDKGENALSQEIRVNSETLNIENRLSTDKYWTPLVLCSEYRLECPSGN